MFYGLSKFIKNLLPKRLFYRALLIVAIPVIVIQLIITIVFFDSLWIKTNKGMTRALVNEIKTFVEFYSDENYDKNEITNLFSVYQDLNIEFVDDKNFKYADCSTCSKKLGLDTYQETNGFFTEYSKTIPSEDMAEVFSHLITNRYQNTNDNILNKKVEFIKDKLSKIDNTFEF